SKVCRSFSLCQPADRTNTNWLRAASRPVGGKRSGSFAKTVSLRLSGWSGYSHGRLSRMYLLWPLVAALAFALGSMVYKRAYVEGAGVAHTAILNNVVLGIMFLPLLAFETRPISWDKWEQPVLTSLAYVLGHLLNV